MRSAGQLLNLDGRIIVAQHNLVSSTRSHFLTSGRSGTVILCRPTSFPGLRLPAAQQASHPHPLRKKKTSPKRPSHLPTKHFGLGFEGRMPQSSHPPIHSLYPNPRLSSTPRGHLISAQVQSMVKTFRGVCVDSTGEEGV